MNVIPTKLVKTTDNPTNTYCLHLRIEHGDADHTTNETYYTKTSEDLERVLRIMLVGLRIPTYEEEQLREKLRQVGKELGADWAEDFYTDLIGYDVTCHGILAQLESITLTWFNEHGVEFYADFEFDGKLYSMLGRYNSTDIAL